MSLTCEEARHREARGHCVDQKTIHLHQRLARPLWHPTVDLVVYSRAKQPTKQLELRHRKNRIPAGAMPIQQVQQPS